MFGCVQVGQAAQAGIRQQFFLLRPTLPDSMAVTVLSTDRVLTRHTFNFQLWWVCPTDEGSAFFFK